MRHALVVATMTMRLGAVVALAALTAVGCSRPNRPALPSAASDAVEWAPSLALASLSAVSARLVRPFADPFDVAALGPNGVPQQGTMASCTDYFAMRQKGFEPLAETDLAAMKVEGATCWALKALETAKPATGRPLRAFSLGQNALTRLPPVLGPMPSPTDTEIRTEATKAGKSWSSVDPEAKVVPNDEWNAQVKGKDWTTDLHVLARGDLNGDGNDDLLIATLSTGSEGSWGEVRLRLLTSMPAAAVLVVAKDYPL